MGEPNMLDYGEIFITFEYWGERHENVFEAIDVPWACQGTLRNRAYIMKGMLTGQIESVFSCQIRQQWRYNQKP